MRFDPSVGDRLHFLGDEFTVQEHPNARGAVFAAEAGRAVVYQIKDAKSRAWALKVFFKKFQSEQVIESTKHLQKVENYEGLMAASRRVVLPNDQDAQKYEALHYAVVMRWVPGRTWFDLLEMGTTNAPIHQLPNARRLTERFLKIMEQLESSGIAHTDISAGNVTVEHFAKDTQLLDLEDMYLPRAPRPRATTSGTPGYSHADVERRHAVDPRYSTWQAAGDRYAAAILAAELLLMSEEGMAREAESGGYFTGHRDDPKAQTRFRTAESYLQQVAPNFCKLFVHAWTSDQLTSCPLITQLHLAVRKDWSGIMVPTPASTPDSEQETKTPTSAVGQVRVRFEKWDDRDERVRFEADPVPERPATTPTHGATSRVNHPNVRWDSSSSAPTNPGTTGQPVSNRTKRSHFWRVVLLVILIVIGLICVVSVIKSL